MRESKEDSHCSEFFVSEDARDSDDKGTTRLNENVTMRINSRMFFAAIRSPDFKRCDSHLIKALSWPK